jgi:hypothetical protein
MLYINNSLINEFIFNYNTFLSIKYKKYVISNNMKYCEILLTFFVNRYFVIIKTKLSYFWHKIYNFNRCIKCQILMYKNDIFLLMIPIKI